MTDGIISGTGNSRFLKSVANAMTLYPTHEALMEALVSGTFPIDLNGINPAGWETVGDKLDKATLLTDALCTALGLATTATPTQAMDKLRQLVGTAQAGVDNGVKTQIVAYLGTGDSGAQNPCSVTFSFLPILVIMLGRPDELTLCVYNGECFNLIIPSLLTTSYKSYSGFVRGTSIHNSYAKKSNDGKTIYWYNGGSSSLDTKQYNEAGVVYYVLGIS